MKKLKAQAEFVEALFANFRESMNDHIANYGKKDSWGCSINYMNKNHGKNALKRKIKLIRQELLNLEKLIDKENIYEC